MEKTRKGRLQKRLRKPHAPLPEESAREFYRKTLALQEEEKKRISRDLHDETGQVVTALGAVFNILQRRLEEGKIQEALDIIRENRKLVQEITEKMKFMAFKLRPPALDILGLSAVLREYFSQCTSSNSIRIEFKENLKDAKLDENIEISLYRIVQETIYNVLKHAQADRVKVEFMFFNDTVQLVIEDNGKGFDVEKFEASVDISRMGLRGVRERVDLLNGTFSIHSLPGEGTKIQIQLPLKK